MADLCEAGVRQEGQEGDEEGGQDVHCNSHPIRHVLASLSCLLLGSVLLPGKSRIQYRNVYYHYDTTS